MKSCQKPETTHSNWKKQQIILNMEFETNLGESCNSLREFSWLYDLNTNTPMWPICVISESLLSA